MSMAGLRDTGGLEEELNKVVPEDIRGKVKGIIHDYITNSRISLEEESKILGDLENETWGLLKKYYELTVDLRKNGLSVAKQRLMKQELVTRNYAYSLLHKYVLLELISNTHNL